MAKRKNLSSLLLQIILGVVFVTVLHLGILCVIDSKKVTVNNKSKENIPIIWDLPVIKEEFSNNTLPKNVEENKDENKAEKPEVDMASELMKVMQEDIYKSPPVQSSIEEPYSPSQINNQEMPISEFFEKPESNQNFTPPENWGKLQSSIMEGNPNNVQQKNNRIGDKSQPVLNGGNFFNGLQGYDNLETNFDFLPSKDS
mgnify:CR=1 FL=1